MTHINFSGTKYLWGSSLCNFETYFQLSYNSCQQNFLSKIGCQNIYFSYLNYTYLHLRMVHIFFYIIPGLYYTDLHMRLVSIFFLYHTDLHLRMVSIFFSYDTDLHLRMVGIFFYIIPICSAYFFIFCWFASEDGRHIFFI